MIINHSQHWRVAGLSLAILLILVFGLYFQTVLYLTGLWNQLETGNYTHGYLVLAISIYLIACNRQALIDSVPCPNALGLLAVLGASMLWMLAVMVDVQMMQTVGLLLLILAAVWTVLGNSTTRLLLFPILFLGFAIPIWFPLSPFLQDLTADVVFWLIRIIEVPALRQENMIVLPAGAMSIEEACSGLRYFLAALTLGTLYAYLNYSTLKARLIVVLVSACAAVLANILRVFIVVYLGYTTDMQHPLVDDHLYLGWYLFGGLVVILLFLDVRIQKYIQPGNADGEGALIQNEHKAIECSFGLLQSLAIIVAGILLVSIGPAALLKANNRDHEGGAVTLNIPAGVGSWAGPESSTNNWIPEYNGAITGKQDYYYDTSRVSLYIGYYPSQKQGKELINDLNRISNNDIWKPRYVRARLYKAGDHRVLEQVVEDASGSKLLVWFWYRVAGRITTNDYEAKALQVLGLLKGMRQASVIAIAAKLNDEPEHVRKILGDFAEEMGPSIDRVIDGKI